MAIRFVEREPGREETTQTAAVPVAPPPADLAPTADERPDKRRKSAEERGAAPKAEAPEPEPRDAGTTSAEPSDDGMLPGLTRPDRPPKRKRGRMMGFG